MGIYISLGRAAGVAVAGLLVARLLRRRRSIRQGRQEGDTAEDGSEGGAEASSRAGSMALPGGEEDAVEWIGTVLGKLWPSLDKAVEKIVHDDVLPALRAALPKALQGAYFEKITLGTKKPVVGPIRIVPSARGVKMVAGIKYESNCEIELNLVVATLGIKSVRLAGELTFRIAPIINEMPVLGGMVMYFVDPPTIDLQFVGLAQLAHYLGLAGTIRGLIDSQLAGLFVLPHVIPVALGSEEQGVHMANLNKPQPLGVLRAAAVRASGLTGADWHLFSKNTSDPYVKLSISDVSWRSSAVQQTCDPTWKEEDVHDFLVFDLEQTLKIEVFDEDLHKADDHIGRAAPIRISDAAGMSGKPIKLFCPTNADEQCGELTLHFEWLSLIKSELGPDHRCVVSLRVAEVRMPGGYGHEALVAARLGTDMERSTLLGVHVAPEATACSVGKALVAVARRCRSRGWGNDAIAEVTGLDKEELREIFGGSGPAEAPECRRSVKEQTQMRVHIHDALFFKLPKARLSWETLAVRVVDKEKATIAEKEIQLSELSDAQFKTMPPKTARGRYWQLPGKTDERIEVFCKLSIWGLKQDDTTWASK